MSYIHEALKKAQKERDALYHKYHGIVSASGYRPKFFSRKALWLASFLLISLAFTTYLWLPFRGTHTPIHEPETPEATKRLQSPVSVVGLYEKAKRFQKRGRLQEARRLYEETLNRNPDYVDALNNLGVIHIHDKRYAEAQSSFKKAIGLKPDYVDPYYNLACLHAIKGEVTQSLGYLKKAVSLDPSAKDWAQKDTDLTNLHGVREFERIVGSEGVANQKYRTRNFE